MEAEEIITNIKSIYAKHTIPKNLERHMFLVAGVIDQFTAQCTTPIDRQALIAAGLIHDLGNIIKMDLSDPARLSLLDASDRKHIAYLQDMQKKHHAHYGTNAEEANVRIAQDLGVSKKILSLLDPHVISFKTGKATLTPDIEKQIILYGDLRVAPHGVVTLNERLEEYAKRYRVHVDPAASARSKEYVRAAHELEKNLFTHATIKPNDITMDSVLPLAKKYGWVAKKE